jgi:hypothetical protein
MEFVLGSESMLLALFDLRTALGVGIPLLGIGALLHITARVHWAVTLRDLGIPIGLLSMFVNVLSMLSRLDDFVGKDLGFESYLIAVLYGGLAAAVGYFCSLKLSESDEQQESRRITWLVFIFCVAFMSIGVGIMLSEMDIMSFFKSWVHLFTLAIVIFVFAVSPRNQLLRSLAKAMLLGAVCAILIYLSLFLDNVKVEGGRIGIVIASGLHAMAYALLIYIWLYLLSYKLEHQERINAGLMSWHWLEVSGFFIFFLFGIPSLNDIMDDPEYRIQQLEERVEELSLELDSMK